jgi:hypothetical protein
MAISPIGLRGMISTPKRYVTLEPRVARERGAIGHFARKARSRRQRGG